MEIENGKFLKISDIVRVARSGEAIKISKKTFIDIEQSNLRLEGLIKNGQPVYGVNTGYGIFSEKTIKQKDIAILNRNLIKSHAVAVGDPLNDDIVRAAMLIRANTLSKGFSGVRKLVITTLLEMLNKGVTPIIPSQGSLGSSGDLCQLSHLALILSRDENDLESESGMARINGNVLSGKEAMSTAGIDRVVLSAKEGLALNNGATFSAAIAALAIFDAEYLLNITELATALTMEALCATSSALDERIHKVRNQIGQIASAKKIHDLLDGSTYINSSNRVQEAYSIRCAPQIHGAIRDTIDHAKMIIEREINAATDNPLIFEPGIAISGGNFHGEPVGLVMDFLAIAMSELGAVSERRTNRLVDEKLNNGLPPMLADDIENAGLNSGLMIPHYTAASLVLENQTLANPDSVHSLPTSASQEDHNANAMTAARHAMQVVNNVGRILSIELFTASRALEFRKKLTPGKMGIGTGVANDKIRSKVDMIPGDMLWGPEIDKVYRMLNDRVL